MGDAEAILVAGLALGDEGKGASVDWLARETGARLVVRYNGGCQAGHRVVLSDGREHIFSQFGSASFLPGARTFLSRFMLVDPLALVTEATALEQLLGYVPPLGADPRCLVVTPWHKAANRLRELARGANRHGSCGRGVGEAVRVSIERPELASHLSAWSSKDLLQELRLQLADEVSQWFNFDPEEARVLQDANSVRRFISASRPLVSVLTHDLNEFRYPDEQMIFEGAQGVLLDQDHGLGTPDHATWSDCTFGNAEVLCDEVGINDAFKLGVIRTHLTRHGAGPFPSEDATLPRPTHEHNSSAEPWQGCFRIGTLDQPTLEYASRVIGRLDGIALTHCDWTPDWLARAEMVAQVFDAPVVATADGPTAQHRKWS